MLKNLPIIPSQTSKIFTHYYFIPIAPPIILFYSIVSLIMSQWRVTIYNLYTIRGKILEGEIFGELMALKSLARKNLMNLLVVY